MTRNKITKLDVLKVAQLSRLDISGQEDVFVEKFNDTLEKIATINELNLEGIKETYQVTGFCNVYQDKENAKTHKSLLKEKALSNASEVQKGLFATKAVFDRESGES
jgi:aspartyl/glutamyl-tRNA(Asn/Gln) amidotransferase C subunit